MDKKSKIFLVLCFIASLLLGIILSAALLLTPPIFVEGFSYLIIIGILVSLTLLTYFSFSSFDIQEKTILFLTPPISIIISITTYIANYFLRILARDFVSQQQQTEFGLGNIGSITSLFDFNHMLNIWVLIALIIIIYNIFPIIFILFKKEPQQQVLQ